MRLMLIAALIITVCGAADAQNPPNGFTEHVYFTFGGSTLLSTYDRSPLHGGEVEFSYPLSSGYLKAYMTLGSGYSYGFDYGREVTAFTFGKLYTTVGLNYHAIPQENYAIKYVALPIGAELFIPLGETDGISVTADVFPNVEILDQREFKLGRGGISFLAGLSYTIGVQ